MSGARLPRGARMLVATHNAGKLREIGELLAPYGVDATSAGALGLPEPEETETSFAGNARIKAHAAAKASGLPALADDSGLSVAALDGAPGVYTADWAETPEGRDFALAMGKVRDELAARDAPQPWRAAFHCVLCLAWPDGSDQVFHGTVEGVVVWPPRGENGHGYDPMFVRDGETLTFGELSPEEKNARNHRADAFQRFEAACLADAAT